MSLAHAVVLITGAPASAQLAGVRPIRQVKKSLALRHAAYLEPVQ